MDISRARRLLREIRDRTDELEELLNATAGQRQPPGYQRRQAKVLAKMYDLRRPATFEEWHAIGREAGYPDPRGLAGFFRGRLSSEGAVCVDHDGSNVFLTDFGRTWIENFRRQYPGAV
jgi:hypothetical protein